MIDTKKVRMMTWLSEYENGIGKKDLKMNQKSRRTYTALRLIESVVVVTMVFVVCSFFYAFRFYTDVMSGSQDLSLFKQLLPLLVAYLVVIAMTVIITNICCGRKYRAMQQRVMEYDRNLYRLNKYLNDRTPE